MKFITGIFVCITICVLLFFASCAVERFSVAGQFTILYSLDKKQNDRALINVINSAHQYVYFAIYEFTKENIAEALMSAKDRGLDVEGIADASQSAGAQQAKIIASLREAGIPVETQKHPEGIMHIKALVTDNAYALGSYNWTSAATFENDEILEIGTNDDLRRQYLAILQKILQANR
jgi:phosphatidylserine/phosphatidylglycerophosphate/cardiolipin synthase-like enzyme